MTRKGSLLALRMGARNPTLSARYLSPMPETALVRAFLSDAPLNGAGETEAMRFEHLDAAAVDDFETAALGARMLRDISPALRFCVLVEVEGFF